jgi:hypothetical protein
MATKQIGDWDYRDNVRVRGGLTDGQALDIKAASQLLSGLSGASVTATGIIPAGSIPVGIGTKVETAITGATGYDVGDGSDVDRWGANIAVALDTISDNQDWTAQGITNFNSAGDVVLTAVGGSFTAGAVRVTVHYFQPVIA